MMIFTSALATFLRGRSVCKALFRTFQKFLQQGLLHQTKGKKPHFNEGHVYGWVGGCAYVQLYSCVRFVSVRVTISGNFW